MAIDREEKFSLVEARERQMIGPKCEKIVEFARNESPWVSVVGGKMFISVSFGFRRTMSDHITRLRVLARGLGLDPQPSFGSNEVKIALDEGVGKIEEIVYSVSKDT